MKIKAAEAIKSTHAPSVPPIAAGTELDALDRELSSSDLVSKT